MRERILRRNTYLCQLCEREDLVTAATQVDHIRPKAKGGSDDPTCHGAKSAADRGARVKVRVGHDGWPVK